MGNGKYVAQPSSWDRKTIRWVTIRDLDPRVGNPAASCPLGGGDKVEGGLWGEEEEELAPCNPPIPVWPGEREPVLVACTRTACPGAPELRPGPIMTLRPLLLPLRLLLLLLISGAVCGAEAGPETESPVRTLQVETLVRRLWCPPQLPPCSRRYPLRPGIAGEGVAWDSKWSCERREKEVQELSWGERCWVCLQTVTGS